MHPTPPIPALLPRRRLLGRALVVPLSPLLALAGCATPWPEVPPGPGSASARSRLREAADAQGLARWQRLNDVNLGYDALPWPAAHGLQRGGPAQMRLLPRQGRIALHADPLASGSTPLAAALHRLLLLGPLALAGWDGIVNWAEPQTIDNRRCDHLHLPLAPGLAQARSDRLSLWIDRDEGLLRRLQVSLTTLGPDHRVDVVVGGHHPLDGITWPTRWQAGALHWQLTGLDLDRGYGTAALDQAPWAAPADRPARALPVG